MISLHSAVVALSAIDNPFKASETDTEQIGFVAICAGLIIAINILLLSVALAAKRRGPRYHPPASLQWQPPVPRVLDQQPEGRPNPLHVKRAQREAERLAAEAAAKRAAPMRPAPRRTPPSPPR